MDMDIYIHVDTNTTQQQPGNDCNGTLISAEPPTTTAATTLMTLPTEILLQILSSLSLPVLLDFRLVCSWADTLVLEPVFWHRLEFSKQLLFKTGGNGLHHHQQQQQHRRTNFGLGGGASLSTGGTGGGAAAGAGIRGGRESVFQHHSDANLIVHRLSLAASLLGPTMATEDSWAAAAAALSGLEAGGPSMTISANITRLPSKQQHQQYQQLQQSTLSTSPTTPSNTTVQQQQQLSNLPTWTIIENSFLLFLTRLTSITRTSNSVKTVVIEDWEGVESVQEMWSRLKCFRGLRSLAVRNSVLRHLGGQHHYLHSHNDINNNGNNSNDADKEGLTGVSWPDLKELDFQDCTQLNDLDGLQHWLPHLQDLSLAGCTHLEDFSTLFHSCSLSGLEVVDVVALKKASLAHTRIRDDDLIALLRKSPELEELRLDQCYGLTVRALEAIAFGDQKGPVTAVAVAATVTAAGGGVGSLQGLAVPAAATTTNQAGFAAMATDQQVQHTPPYHNTDHHDAGPSFTLTTSSPPPPLHPFSISTTSSSSASNPAPLPSQPAQIPTSTSGSYCPQLRKLSLKNCYDFTDDGIRSLVGCRHLEWLVIRGIRQVNEDTAEWLHSQGVPLRKLLSPLGRWRHWHV
ncbi:MAG: hypothetical protein J3R72DRAFT_441696 [Linnemannia gamsii]|nr:MAG: hypothetical protein J3R72DRAFT_441696 [Linnemannia gamsii]